MRSLYILALSIGLVACASPATDGGLQPEGANVILVTYDGLRWQEMYAGVDSLLLNDPEYTRRPESMAEAFWDDDPAVRRERLLPFFWSVVASEGQLYGNRWLESEGTVTNGRNFSYPGYNEILSGRADDWVASNDKIPNRNVTVLEWVNGQPGFEGRVGAFGSWDVFPWIVNEERSGVPVNAGFEVASGEDLSDREVFLNELQPQIPSPWSTVRLDAFTHHYAKEYMMTARPRLIYIAYGETDDFAHDEDYDAYIWSAHNTDSLIRDLWGWTQATEGYRNNTYLVVTTDHGRGWGDEWSGHGSDMEGADHIWLAVLGPGVEAFGESADLDFRQEQVAATVAALLVLDFTEGRDVAPPVESALPR